MKRKNQFLTPNGRLNADGRRLRELASRTGSDEKKLRAEYREKGYDDFSIQRVFHEANDGRRLIQQANRRRKGRDRPPGSTDEDKGGPSAASVDTLADLPVTKTGFSQRLLRLFACACCRRIFDRLAPNCRRAVEIAERFADGLAEPAELDDARQLAERLEVTAAAGVAAGRFLAEQSNGCRYYQFTERVHQVASPKLKLADVWAVANDLWPWRGDSLDNAEAEAAHNSIFRDVFGGPVWPWAFDAAWRTAPVLSLARSVYERREFARMPELGDALAAAGCRDAALLDHYRSAPVHVRGCWALDAVLDFD
jgi:hypothetical protein